MEWAVIVFIALAAFFSITGHIGLLSAPDVYTRLQTSSTCSTTAILSTLIAALLFTWFSPFTGKIFAIIVFFLLTNPVATHIIARFAWEEGAVPWRKPR
ncbi:MAG: monovalent cation/H(+) antiporter subunit G [Spirochaetaceae bacterium]